MPWGLTLPTGSDPMELLRAYRLLRDQRPELILAARDDGHTWPEIADAAGMTRVSVIRLAASVNPK